MTALLPRLEVELPRWRTLDSFHQSFRDVLLSRRPVGAPDSQALLRGLADANARGDVETVAETFHQLSQTTRADKVAETVTALAGTPGWRTTTIRAITKVTARDGRYWLAGTRPGAVNVVTGELRAVLDGTLAPADSLLNACAPRLLLEASAALPGPPTDTQWGRLPLLPLARLQQPEAVTELAERLLHAAGVTDEVSVAAFDELACEWDGALADLVAAVCGAHTAAEH